MPQFSRKPKLTTMVGVRLTDEQRQVVDGLAATLGVRGASEVFRIALDYYLEHSKEGRAAAKSSSAGK